MADRKTATALTKTPVTVAPFSVATLDFIDSKPNYFRVQNSGESTIYCGTSGYPTTHSYDFLVKPSGLMSFADPHAKTKLYIFNPSGTEVNCVVVSFAAEFDPLVLALGQIEIEVPDTIESKSVISSFEASLPEGNNNIGKVVVSNLPTDYAKEANQKDYTSNFTVVNDWLEKLLTQMWYEYKEYDLISSGTATADGVSVTPSDGYRIFNIGFFANDGSGDITLKLLYSGNYKSIVVKAGEKLSGIKCYCEEILVVGSGDYRLICAERKKV